MNPAVVVSAYNRPQALARLLGSLREAAYPKGVPVRLVLSLDDSDQHPEVAALAESFRWEHGPKQVLRHTRRLGPVGHFTFCGSLSQEYGAIVFLEDDLVVSPVYYAYARQALAYYVSDPAIGGLCLYALWFNGYTQEPFEPLSDETDAFFLQVPYTQGLAFTAGQWSGFQEWRKTARPHQPDPRRLHAAWARFRADEWFPWLARYLVASGKYFVFPRVSLATGFGDAGTHFPRSTDFFQAPLQRAKQAFCFQPLERSDAVYDSFFELLPERARRLAPSLRGYDFTVDLYATRAPENIPTPYILTARRCRNPVLSFGRVMRPLEANLEHAVPGQDICLCRTEDVRWDRLAEVETRLGKLRYFSRGRRAGLGLSLLDRFWRRR